MNFKNETEVVDLDCADVGNHVPWYTGMWVLILEMVIVVIVVSVVYSQFGSFRNRPWWCSVLVILGWSNTMLVAFMIPNDLQSTQYKGCQSTPDDPCTAPVGLVAWQTLNVAWRVQYIMGLVITYILCPFSMNYTHSAQFTVPRRLWEALKAHVLIYGSLLLLGAIGLIYIAVSQQLSWGNLEGVIAGVSLAWALFLLVCFMGFGLEEIPREVWRTSIPDRNRKYFQYRASELANSLEDAEYKLNSSLKLLRKVDSLTNAHDPYRIYVDTIISKCEVYYAKVTTQAGDWPGSSYDELVELHEKILHRRWKLERTQALLQRNYDQAFEQEDIIRAPTWNLSERPVHEHRRIPWQFRQRHLNCCTRCSDGVEYIWYVYMQPYVLKVCALVAALLSLTIVWSETVLWSNSGWDIPSLSPFYYIVKYAQIRYISGQFIVFALLSYIMVCSFSSLLKLRIFDYYHILPHHQSDAHSLLFSAAWLCRLILPIAYNFLLLLNSFHKQGDGSSRELGCQSQTAFETIFLHMGNLADWFAIWLPLGVVILAVCSFFSIHLRIMKLFGIKFFKYFNGDDDQDDHVIYGRDLIDRERSRRLAALSKSRSTLAEYRTDASISFLSSEPRLHSTSGTGSHAPGRSHTLTGSDVFVPPMEEFPEDGGDLEDDDDARPMARTGRPESVASFIGETEPAEHRRPTSTSARFAFFPSSFTKIFSRKRSSSPTPEFLRDDYDDSAYPPRRGQSNANASAAPSRDQTPTDWSLRESSFSQPVRDTASWDDI